MKRILLSNILLFAFILSVGAIGSAAPKREVRAVWMTTLGGLDWPKAKATSASGRERQKAELCERLDEMARTGINVVYLQTRVRGSVIYPSAIEPWDVALTGQYDTDPGYDPLGFAIEECHKRGMELHAWIVTIPAFKISQAKLVGRKSLMKTHPKWLIRQNDSYYLDPSRKETATYLADICAEVTSRYDVDGIHLDYIRYPEGTKQDRQQWRRDNITAIVRACHKAVKSHKPWVRMSCSPVGKHDNVRRYSARGWAAYSTVFQDAQGWLREGIMDMLSPMMYFQGDHFYPFAADWQEMSSGRTIVPGLGIYFLSPKEKNWDLVVITRELQYLRSIGAGGQAYFRNQFLRDDVKGLQTYLREQFYTSKALLPPMTWEHDSIPPRPVIKESVSVGSTGHRVTFEKAWSGGAPCRHVIYASKSYPVDTEDAANIVCTLWGDEYTYDRLATTLYGLHIASTTLDAYGNESEATYITYDE